MAEVRRHFHEELEGLELDVLGMGEVAERMLANAMTSLAESDIIAAGRVIDSDDDLDGRYMMVERRTLELLALQTPVAIDLRLISAILHTNVHLERVGDMAVNIAKIVRVVHGLPVNQTILSHLAEMGDIARQMLRASMDALARRDIELATKLPEMDDPVDRLNRGMYREVASCAWDPQMLEWAIRMMVVSRQLERIGDHAVDIAEQVAFLITGEFREFTDASHPEVEGAG
ncbi:MAG TPA: phosphate signaling complex protein PhoU [Actinomycetota bacterium]|nr:phosphate signaling complex protein PhoU [Actinomycetota bacterium]